MKTGGEIIEAIIRRRRILFAGFVARMENTGLPKYMIFGELTGGAGCVGGQEQDWMGCLLDDFRVFGINADQWTTAAQDERGMSRDGGRRGGSFQGEVMDRYRESQDWTTCRSIPERDGKDQGKDSPKQASRAGSFARHS